MGSTTGTSAMVDCAFANRMILPFFTMGLYNDLVMRCSVPALFVLCLASISYISDFVEHIKERKSKMGVYRFIAFVVVLCSGLSTPLVYLHNETTYAVALIKHKYHIWDRYSPSGEFAVYENSLEKYANRYDPNISDDLKYNYYSYDIDENLFYKYVARVRDE